MFNEISNSKRAAIVAMGISSAGFTGGGIYITATATNETQVEKRLQANKCLADIGALAIQSNVQVPKTCKAIADEISIDKEAADQLESHIVTKEEIVERANIQTNAVVVDAALLGKAGLWIGAIVGIYGGMSLPSFKRKNSDN